MGSVSHGLVSDDGVLRPVSRLGSIIDSYFHVTRDSRGAVMVEAATVSLVLFLILLGILEISLISYRQLTLYYVTASAARWGTLGHTTVNSFGQPLNRLDSVKEVLVREGKKYGVAIKQSDIRICKVIDGSSCVVESIGGKGDVFFINSGLRLPALTAFMTLTLKAQAVGKNEP